MMNRKQTGIWMMAVALVFLPLRVGGHDGEDHGATKPTVAKSGSTTQLAKTDEIEVLLKYPKLVSGRETKLALFITDFKTNGPKSRLSLNLKLVQEKTARTTSLVPTVLAASESSTTAMETPMPGMYEAVVTPSEAGSLLITVQVTGQSLKESMTFSGIAVASDLPVATQPPNLLMLLVLGIGVLTLALGLRWWLRRHPPAHQLSVSSGDQS